MSFLNLTIYIVVFITVLSLIYRIKPHQTLPDEKPQIAFLPKYAFQIDPDTAIANLKAAGFTKHEGTDTYVRGYFLGDFSANVARLNIVLKDNMAHIHSPLMVILFDTGDLWKIAKDIQADRNSGANSGSE